MRIGIDARFYGTLGKGLGRYVSELLAQLEKIDSVNEYVVFLRRENFGDYSPTAPNFRKVLAEFPWYGWKEQLFFPFWLSKFGLDLMHFTHFNVPLLYSGPFVVTIHDLIMLNHPRPRATTLGPITYRLKNALAEMVVRHAVRSARQVITVSEYSRDEILKRFPFLTPNRISVTYEACSELIPEAENTAVLQAKKPFILYVGSAYPHKNLERLITAFSDFRKRGFEEWHLMLVGNDDHFYSRLRNESIINGTSDNITFFGRASESELASLYRQADFYVFPSLAEGFGLPPLEAMCSGLPVTASSASCLPEILEGAADWFSPEDVRDITGALVRLAGNPSLRQDLSERGLRQAAKYSWRKCVEQTVETYRITSPQ